MPCFLAFFQTPAFFCEKSGEQLGQGQAWLRLPHERFPDQEVAAHLGEVLWASGKQREAKKIWATFLKENPDSPILRKTVLRLTGSETL